MNRLLRAYWVIYYLCYLSAVAALLWAYWPNITQADANTALFLTAAIFGAAAGAATIIAILVEAGGRAVLLIPKAVKEIMDKGRAEGRKEGRQQRDERYEEALDKFGVEVEGVLMLPDTPEIREFLQSPPGE